MADDIATVSEPPGGPSRRSGRLADTKTRISLAELLPQQKKTPKTKSEINRDYREKIKADTDKFAEQKLKNKLKAKEHRQNQTPEMKLKAKEQSRIRMAKMRERKKADKDANTKPTTRKDKEATAALKEKWRLDKVKYRENRTPQKGLG